MRGIAAVCCCFLMGLAVASAKELVRLEIQLGLNKGVENLYVGKDVEELVFEKPSYIESIKGLGQLDNLSVMIFNNTHFVTDFSFLKEAPHIKTLIISGVRILDTQFLEHLPELEFLVLDTCRLKNIEFDFISLQKLRFIDLSNNDLDSIWNGEKYLVEGEILYPDGARYPVTYDETPTGVDPDMKTFRKKK